jgi:hypothetical protein
MTVREEIRLTIQLIESLDKVVIMMQKVVAG